MPRKVAIFVPPQAQLLSIAAPTDLLQLANRFARERTSDRRKTTAATRSDTAPIASRWLSLDGAPVALASGGSLPIDGRIDDTERYDAVFLGAFEAAQDDELLATLDDCRALAPWLRRQHEAGAMIAACGSAVFLLAESGLLDHRAATAPWWQQRLFHQRYPAVRLDVAQRLTQSHGLHCAGSLSGLLPVTLRVTQRLTSPNTADWLAKTTLIDTASEPESPHAAQLRAGAAGDALVAAAQYQLQQRYAEKWQIADLARSLAVSPRTLVRRFQRALGLSPQAYVQRLRIEAAQRMMLRTSLRVERIAQQVGYSDPAFFKRLFRQQTGMTPHAWRQQSTPPSPESPAHETP